MEEEYWKQRSRHLWLSLGDKNTAYFHAATKARKARNKLSILEGENGEIYYEEDQIADTITSYFKTIFTSSNNDCAMTVNRALQPKVTDAMNEQLIQISTAAEIKVGMFSIHPDKASGPDGFSASFFQSNWDTVGPAMIKEIQLFFTTGVLSSTINTTHLRLIPKIKSPTLVSKYRPIALCNVYYKVI